METKILKTKIILYPTKIVIDGYYERISAIESKLNVWNSVTFSYDFQAYIKEEEKNKITIPNCYTVKFLKSLFPSAIIENRIPECIDSMDKLKQINPINMKYNCRDIIQEKAVKYLNEKVNNRCEKYRATQRFLCLKTGEGKTFCTVKTIVENKDRPIIFVDQEALGLQWIERIKEYTDTKDDEIYYISGTPSIKKLMNKTNEEIMKIKFFVCCYRTITNNLKITGSSKEVSELLVKIRINLKVYDEAHVEYTSIFKIDMIHNGRSIYLSATPSRSSKEEDKVYQNIFYLVPKFFSYMVEEIEEKNYHNIIEYNYNTKPSLVEQLDCKNKYGFSMASYCNYILNKKYDLFFEMMINLLFDVIMKNRRKKKLAILLGSNALIEKFNKDLCNLINDRKYKLTVGVFNGTVKKNDKQEILDNSDIIITTDKSFGKGIDVKGLQIAINTVPFSSETKLIQTIGRLREIPNREVFFVDVNDLGFDAIKNQLRIKENKVYKKISKKYSEFFYKKD